jgi:uncharacterized protein YkwD
MRAPPGDKGAVSRKLSLLLTAALLIGLAIALPAAAEGSGQLIAPVSICPGQGRLDAPAEAQESTMRCMTNFARAQAGEAGVATVQELEQSAGDKADDILRCDSFSHFACGRDFTYWMQQVGYTSSQCWRVGENLAWGTDGYGSVRAIFRAWMNSPGHRENILGNFTQIGIGLRIGTLAGQPKTHVWTQHFGSHCEPPVQP